MTPFTISRGSTARFRPPRLAGGMSGSMCDHSSSVRSLGERSFSRLYFGGFSDVHIGGSSSNQAANLESQMTHPIQLLPGRTLSQSRYLASTITPYHKLAAF